jgi:hypothetical protein
MLLRHDLDRLHDEDDRDDGEYECDFHGQSVPFLKSLAA